MAAIVIGEDKLPNVHCPKIDIGWSAHGRICMYQMDKIRHLTGCVVAIQLLGSEKAKAMVR